MSTAQFDRDLRSAHIDFKRSKDHRAKWEHGARGMHAGGLNVSPDADSDALLARGLRPRKPMVRYWVMPSNNIQKPDRGHRSSVPPARHRETSRALLELQESKALSTSEILQGGPAAPTKTTRADTFVAASASPLYSFDHNAPAAALPLDAFIKAPTVRDTEKMIKNEYEVLDANGEAVHGRKARAVLRQAAANSPLTQPKLVEVVDDDDDDFELV
ncbi:hypothetical protein SPBR_06197 [Sporothrix brasiliensis 5110]|uniref:Uncharacterized protein n=1 Tax=Sporothrix brasiliensis 5110 TaxID=1398154 RepID=A0A0C2F4U5_9PEZI|nr:uncharacterized protein SPBR_06197 [Sporothrix brasiliensis 5110]KIH93944.1 hypothetical protein SPBR_06197 [Sporothrix brasiliensis 5110]